MKAKITLTLELEPAELLELQQRVINEMIMDGLIDLGGKYKLKKISKKGAGLNGRAAVREWFYANRK